MNLSSTASRPSLRQMQYFVALAEHGSFSAAAQTLAVSQPSLSKQLATMEDDLDAVLFERTSRRVKLTRIGEKLLPRARMILQEMSEFRAIARGSEGLFGDRLSIGVLPSIGAYFMPVASRLLHKLYPHLRLIIREGSTKELLSLLNDGTLDAVIGSPTNEPDFVSKHLFSEILWVCAAPDDPISRSKEPITLDELSNKPLLSLSSSFKLAEIVDRLASLAGTYVSRDYQGASLDAVRQMSVMGAGVAILPSLYALAEAVRDPEFVVRRLDHPEAIHEIALIWRKSSPVHHDCLKLIEHLVEAKQEIPETRPKSPGDENHA